MKIPYICKHCGCEVRSEHFGRMATQRLIKQICYECDRWLTLANSDQTNLWVINGQLFELKDELDEFEKFKCILTPEKALKITSLYNFGIIPERFLGLFSKKARFINLREYNKISFRSGYTCNKKGCWGRNQCWWYRGDDDYNDIPKKQKKNPENCPIFIERIN